MKNKITPEVIKETVQAKNDIADIRSIVPQIADADLTQPVIAAFADYILYERFMDSIKEELQCMIDSGASKADVQSKLDSYIISIKNISNNFLKSFNSLSMEDNKAFKIAYFAVSSKKYAPADIQNHPIQENLIRGKADGHWRLKPEAFTLNLKKEWLPEYSADNKQGLNIESTINKKSKEYPLATAGLRGASDAYFPWNGDFMFNFAGEAITMFSQNMYLLLNAKREDSALQQSIFDLRNEVIKYRTEKGIADDVKNEVVLAEMLSSKSVDISAVTNKVSEKLIKLAGSETRFNSIMYQEIAVRIAAAMGIQVKTPPLEGDNKISIWLASFLTFTEDYDQANYETCSHGPMKMKCMKDLSDEGAQFLPDVSMTFAEVNEMVLQRIKDAGDFPIKFAAENDPNIDRSIDGIEEYYKMLQENVTTKPNLAKIKEAVKKGYSFVQDCAAGCMGPIMDKLFKKAGISDSVDQINAKYDSYQAGIGKAFINDKTTLFDENEKPIVQVPVLEFDDQGVDASRQDVVERMYYETLFQDAPIGKLITNTDPDGDRFVVGQIMKNDAATLEKLNKFGIKYIQVNDEKIYAYYSPNKMFLMTTAYYLEQQVKSGNLKKGDTAVLIKTAQTSYAFNEYAEAATKKYGIKVVCIEPTVGFKEIAAMQRHIELQMKENETRIANGQEAQDVVVTDALGHEHNLGTGRIQLISSSEESGGQDLAPAKGITSKLGRFSLGNREKSAGVVSFLAGVMGADFYLNDKLVIDYWDELIQDFGLTYIQDDRHDEKLFNPNQPDPKLAKIEMAEGNKRKDICNEFWWDIARASQEGLLSLDQIKGILVETFPELDKDVLMSLKEITPILTDADEEEARAKDGIYMLFDGLYIAIRPSGTEPVIKGYYSGRMERSDGLAIAKTFSSYTPDKEGLAEAGYGDLPILSAHIIAKGLGSDTLIGNSFYLTDNNQ